MAVDAVHGRDRPAGPAASAGTKLSPPSLRADRLRRPRITSMFDRSATPLVLVSAPAGFGKSTAVADWLYHRDGPSAWIDLDERDDDPWGFFRLVAAALEPLVGPGRLTGLVSGPTDRPVSASLWAAATVDDLAATEDGTVLVLDDLHRLSDPVVTDALDRVVHDLPPPVRLVLISRADPPIRLGRMRAQGHLTEVRAAELAFTAEESEQLLQAVADRPLSTDAARALNERIEGWPVGLQLAGLSVAGHDRIDEFVLAFAGDDRYVADYLIEEVLDHEQPETQRFLLETAVLDEMTADLCRAVTGNDRAADILDDLVDRNVFLVGLDGAPGWFRYHHLFSDLLRVRLERRSPHRVPEILDVAATWTEDHGDLDRALSYLVRRGDPKGLTAFTRRHMPRLLMHGQVGRHRSWLNQIPSTWVDTVPELLATRAWAEILGLEPERALHDVDRLEQLVATDSIPVLPGQLDLMRAMAFFFAGDRDACLDHTDLALERAHDERQGIASLAHLYRGVVQVIAGQARDAQPELETAARLSDRSGDYYAALSARMSLGAAAVQLGDLEQARHRFESVNDLATTAATNPYQFPLVAAADVGLGVIAFEQLDLDRATTFFRRGIHQLQSTSAVDYAVLGFCRWADTESIGGHHADAEQILTEADDYLDQLGGTAPAALVQALAACEARTLCRRGDLERSWAVHRRASAMPQRGRWELVHPPFELHVTASRLHLAAGDLGAASSEHAHLAAMAGTDVGLGIDTAVLGAQIALAGGDRTRAETLLADALASAGPAGWARPFVDGGPQLAALAAKSGAFGREQSTTIGRLAGGDGDRRRSEQPLVVPLTPRELEVLAEVAAGFTNAEIADRLYISVGTTKRHIANIFMKLDATHRAGAVARARQLGIIA